MSDQAHVMTHQFMPLPVSMHTSLWRDRTGWGDASMGLDRGPRVPALASGRTWGHLPWQRSNVPDFAGVLLSTPPLPGAACQGRGVLFDYQLDRTPPESPVARDERHQDALRICHVECPVRAACLAWRTATSDLGAGVFGGQVFEPTPKRNCRCGAPLPPDAHTQRKHCSETCRKRAHQPLTEPRTITCECGATKTTNQPSQIYCSTECKKRVERKRALLRQKRRRERRKVVATRTGQRVVA